MARASFTHYLSPIISVVRLMRFGTTDADWRRTVWSRGASSHACTHHHFAPHITPAAAHLRAGADVISCLPTLPATFLMLSASYRTLTPHHSARLVPLYPLQRHLYQRALLNLPQHYTAGTTTPSPGAATRISHLLPRTLQSLTLLLPQAEQDAICW